MLFQVYGPIAHLLILFLKDRGDIKLEAQLTGEKGFYDCPVRLSLYGPSGPVERAQIEKSLKEQKLLKATELKQTRKSADEKRAIIQGLRNGGSQVGIGSQQWPDVQDLSLEELQQSSEATSFRAGGDSLQTMAMNVEELSHLPMAAQPSYLRAKLLPYQLQVITKNCSEILFLRLTLSSGPCLDGR